MEFRAPNEQSNRKITNWVRILIFLTPFCYPFRPIIGKYLHLHVYIVMYFTIFLLCATCVLFNSSIRYTKVMALIIALYVILLFFSPDIDTGIKWIVNLCCGVIIANLLYYYRFKAKDAMVFVMGTIVCGTIMHPSIITRLPISLIYCHRVRIPFMEGDVSIGPNSWAVTLSICFLCMCVLLTDKKEKKSLKTLICLAVFFILIMWQLFLTLSRTEIYSLVICLCAAVYRWSLKKKKSVLLVGAHIAIILFIICGVVVLIVSPSLVFSGNNRLTDFDFNGRISVWLTSLHTLSRMNPIQWLFGCGTGGASVYNYKKSLEYYNSIDSYYRITGAEHISTHNTYLDLLISSGIVGTVMFLYYMIKALVLMYKEGSIVFVFPMFILVAGLSGNLLTSWDFCIIIAIIEYYYLNKRPARETLRMKYRQ